VARYDRVIPPGGKGTVTIEIDSSRISGWFEKKAIVWSNDQERLSIALYLKGEVKAHVSLEPGSYISLVGPVGETPPAYVEIRNNRKRPLKITGVDNDRPDRLRCRLEEIRAGFVYRLEVKDISGKEGDYTAHVTIKTDNKEKPTLTVIVRGEIAER
jgi:hypothetical protein